MQVRAPNYVRYASRRASDTEIIQRPASVDFERAIGVQNWIAVAKVAKLSNSIRSMSSKISNNNSTFGDELDIDSTFVKRVTTDVALS